MIYDYSITTGKGEELKLSDYKGKVILIVNTAQLQVKTTRSTQGVAAFSLKKNQQVLRALPLAEAGIENLSRYRTRTLPSAGALMKEEDAPDKQLSML